MPRLYSHTLDQTQLLICDFVDKLLLETVKVDLSDEFDNEVFYTQCLVKVIAQIYELCP
jgi:hypothetical protein